MFGGDWCGWCHKLHGLFRSDPEVRKLIADEYALVPIDLESPNADRLLRECKAALVASGDKHAVGYPFLAVLDADRKIVTAQRTDPLEEGDHHDPKKVRELIPEAADLQVEVYVLPNLGAVNVMIRGLLGEGVAASTRFDPQAKGLGEWLRSRTVSIEESLL